MTHYIEPRESIGYWLGEDDAAIVRTLAERYRGANPETPFALRSFSAGGILQGEEGYYDFDLTGRLPEAKLGEASYAFGSVWSDDERSIDVGIMPLGPVRFYLNGTLHYRSGAVDEMKPDAKAVVPITLKRGWNEMLLELRKTAAGFGCRFGAEEGKVRILQVLAPFAERRGAAGWVYSEPVRSGRYGESGEFPHAEDPEEAGGIRWFPVREWNGAEKGKPNFERIFGFAESGASGYAWSRLPASARGARSVWKGSAAGPATIWLDGTPVAELAGAGEFERELTLDFGEGNVLVRTESGTSGWGFELEVRTEGGLLEWSLPAPVHGTGSRWLYAGPLPKDDRESPEKVQSLKRLFRVADGAQGPLGLTGWSLDGPEERLRPYYENAMLSNKWTAGSATNFGRWDYPLGVTMYGLLKSASLLGRADLAAYARAHIASCTEWHEYSLWDRQAYGFPSVNHQLVLIKMLDNCGSFGSAMLEAFPDGDDEEVVAIADRIAGFIRDRLERREDGAFYRICAGEYSADTLWADDLYMSAPFLIRYARMTGRSDYLDEAASQFLHYRNYLFMPDYGVMSHVYDFKYGKKTEVPWGRGNGWTLFSLSELLEHLPEDHAKRPALLAFFREMCAGVASLQGQSGLWRQVLNDPEAYEEASCTAMFAYAFARGVRFGWLKAESRAAYGDAADRAWRGLSNRALDRQGNVHGVCSGSRYSYTPDYYKYDLLTVVNDNHGTGIMMLAGAEICLLKGGAGQGEGRE